METEYRDSQYADKEVRLLNFNVKVVNSDKRSSVTVNHITNRIKDYNLNLPHIVTGTETMDVQKAEFKVIPLSRKNETIWVGYPESEEKLFKALNEACSGYYRRMATDFSDELIRSLIRQGIDSVKRISWWRRLWRKF